MEFKNLNELLEEIDKTIYGKQKYEIALKNSKTEKKKSNIYNKRYWNPIIADYKQVVKKYEDKLSALYKIINHFNTYPKEILVPFILECINLHEEEKYVHRNIVISQTPNISSDFCPTYTHYEILFPESLLEEEMQIEKKFYVSVLYEAYQQLFNQSKVKYIMMPAQGYLKLVTSNLNLVTYFEQFPYLKEIGSNLIERRIKEPDKKMVEILNDELSFLKEEQKKKIKA